MRHSRFSRYLAAAMLAVAGGAAPRAPAQVLDDHWQFLRSDAAPAADTAGWSTVAVPHTWNAEDALDGGGRDRQSRDGYYRGPGWYAQTFDVPETVRGRRVFIRFEAVGSVAEVYLNGRRLGDHRGAFTAFCFELTDHLVYGGRNEVRVRADNTWRDDVLPLSGDFPIFGGLYRPVALLVREAACFSPLDHGGPGVHVASPEVSPERARIAVRALVSQRGAGRELTLACRILDREGHTAAEAACPVRTAADGDVAAALELRLDRPQLWQGRDDPYLYRVEARLLAGGVELDRSVQPLGVRTCAADPERGFLLNGRPYRLYGVNRHQDRAGKGWAVSAEDHREDLRLIHELGARAVRLAHYPQAAEVFAACDELGLLVWTEIPMVDCISTNPAFAENAREQLTEMIRQNANHPSVFAWGLFNELYNKPTPDPAPLVRELNDLAHREDPLRPTVAATSAARPDLCRITDLVGFNSYPGWYFGAPQDLKGQIERYRQAAGGRLVAVSEYGAGASPRQHEFHHRTKPDARWHPEEWQAYVHEETYRIIQASPDVWGSFVWNMFDFASVWRDEGERPGLNDKGLVTYDRRVRKDAFAFYRANWTRAPFVHVAAQRFTERTEAETDVTVYAAAPEAHLFINGRDLGVRPTDEVRIARWPAVRLAPGTNAVEAEIVADGRVFRDRCEWILNPPSASSPPNPH